MPIEVLRPCVSGVAELSNEQLRCIIISEVCEYLSVSIDDMRSRSRKKPIVRARYIAMYLMKKHTKSLLDEIAGMFTGKYRKAFHHSSVIHGVDTATIDMANDGNYLKEVKEIELNVKIKSRL